MKMIFCILVKIKDFWKLILFFFCVWPGMPKGHRYYLCNISRKKLEIKFIFCIQVNIKVFHKFVLSCLTDVDKHAEITQNNKFLIS